MVARNLTCVVSGGEYRIAQYGRRNGHPREQGLLALGFLRHRLQRNELTSRLRRSRFLSEAELAARWRRCGALYGEFLAPPEAESQFHQYYPQLHHDTGAAVLDLVQQSPAGLELTNRLDFAGDSLRCEWCYVVDLDLNTFEVYEGFNKEPLDPHERFAGMGRNTNDYYPVRQRACFDLGLLPRDGDFLEILAAGPITAGP